MQGPSDHWTNLPVEQRRRRIAAAIALGAGLFAMIAILASPHGGSGGAPTAHDPLAVRKPAHATHAAAKPRSHRRHRRPAPHVVKAPSRPAPPAPARTPAQPGPVQAAPSRATQAQAAPSGGGGPLDPRFYGH